MRTPKTLPDVPTEDELRTVLAVCPETLEGARNRTLLLVLADSGLRANEVLHLLVEDWRPADRGLFVRAGKGRKDRVAFVGPTTARALKAWLARHPAPSSEAFLFCDRAGRPLKYRHLVQVLHRLSTKAGLPANRRLTRTPCATSPRRAGCGAAPVSTRYGGSLATRASRPRSGIAVSWAPTFGGHTAEPERLNGCGWNIGQINGRI